MQLTSLAQTALATEGTVSHSTTHGCKTCAVYAHKKQKDGKRKDDVPSLLKAFKDCGNGGYIESPAGQNYRIAQRLNPVLHNVKIDWLGTWTFSDDLTYWRSNSYCVKPPCRIHHLRRRHHNQRIRHRW